ncbi:hypothetical protein ACSU6B_18045 [Neobacillus sp. C211]|jgi:hypothetical protein|uniref:hypothetical protein n=1 Tax=Bacillaceae TaxID=186817 RepID=UPI001BE98376|nr:hypothetical protein [Bacillus sp. ISL-7]MBT2738460.1 hypothetical protein [Bacillus sp. ISL-7]
MANRTLKLSNVSIYQHRAGNIIVTLDNKIIGGVSSDPNSVRYNEKLFNTFKALLVAEGKWLA